MNKPLKIIIFDGSFQTTTFVNRLAKGLAKKHQVYILGFNEALKTPIKGVQYVKLGTNASKIKFIKTTLYLALSQVSFPLLYKTVRSILKGKRKQLQNQNFKIAVNAIKPNIIHAQWVSNIPFLETILTQKTYPVVLSQRGYHINVRPFIDANNLNYLKQWLPKIAGFHSVSKAISQKGDLIYSKPSKIDHVVYSGLNLSKMHFTEPFNKESKIKLISVGRAHWVKGYEYAIAACAILKKHNVNFSYSIIGAGQDEELIYLKQFYKLENEVTFLNSLQQHQVFKEIEEADVMLLPSIEEGIANVAIEAMALGTLVISTNCGGMEELLEHQKEGWIIPTRSPEALAEAIIEFVEKPELELYKMRYNARKKIEGKFTEKQMLQGMENLYIECLNEAN